VTALAYTGRPSRLGGIWRDSRPPVVDTPAACSSAVERARAFNEVLLVAEGDNVETFVSPDRRLLGGGGIAEFFPTNVDALARPSSAATGGVFTAALQGAKTPEAVFLARGRNRARALVKVGQRASGQRITGLGTPAVGGRRNAVALLAEVGRDVRRRAVVTTGGGVTAVAIEGGSRGAARRQVRRARATRRRPMARSSAPRSTARRRGLFVGRGQRSTSSPPRATSRHRRPPPLLRRPDRPRRRSLVPGPASPGRPSPPGLYRAVVPGIPGKADAHCRRIDTRPRRRRPVTLGGVIVRLGAPRVVSAARSPSSRASAAEPHRARFSNSAPDETRRRTYRVRRRLGSRPARAAPRARLRRTCPKARGDAGRRPERLSGSEGGARHRAARTPTRT
jgi:hypothetical protein